MKRVISIDADSLLYKSCYRHQEPFNLELAYMELMGEVAKIKTKVFDLFPYEKGDEVIPIIVFSPKISFRNEMYPEYKGTRKKASIEGIGELKQLTRDRLGDLVLYVEGVEADDIVNYMARTHNTLVAAIDKDVINANPTSCLNYNKQTWSTPKPQFQIEKWYLIQALMGDAEDNIKGAKGIGKTKATKIVEEMIVPEFAGIVEYYSDYYEALMNYRLVRMDQFDGTRMQLWEEPK